MGADHAHFVYLPFIDLTKELLQGQPCISYALVVSQLDREGFALVDSIGRGYSVFWSLSWRIPTGKFWF
jgi:hypothetical protein